MEMIKFSLIKEFDLIGYWWRPGSESERVFGILSYRNHIVELNLKGLLSSDEDEVSDAEIHGMSEDGHFILLAGCFSISRTVLTLSLIPKERIRASLVLIDEDKNATEAPATFDSIEIGLPQILDSARIGGFNMKVTESGIIDPPFRKVPERQSFPIEVIGATLHVCTYDAFEIGMRSATFEQVGYIELTSDSPQPIRWFTRQAGEIEDLFFLLTSQPCLAQWMKLSSGRGEDKSTYYCILPNKQLDNYYPAGRHEHLVYVCQIGDSFEIVLGLFFKKSPALYPIINILNATLAQPGAFHQLDFVNLTQALEGLHRVFESNCYVEKPEFRKGKEEIKSAIERAFPEEANTELRQNLFSSIQFANAKSQKTRLYEQISQLSPRLKKAIIGENEKFVHEIVSTRNYFVHLDHKSAKKALNDRIIPFRKMQLQMLLICILLKTFGIDDSLILENIERTELYRHFRHKRDE